MKLRFGQTAIKCLDSSLLIGPIPAHKYNKLIISLSEICLALKSREEKNELSKSEKNGCDQKQIYYGMVLNKKINERFLRLILY